MPKKRNEKNWTISPDLALILLAHLKKYKPKVILELGSGLSTIFLAKHLKATDQTVFISLEHHLKFYALTDISLKTLNLQNKVNLFFAPLTDYILNNKNWQWYTTKELKDIKYIDMLIIDGPPGYTNHLSRYPALPILYKKFNQHITIFLDDAKREDERKIIQMWLSEFPDLQVKIIDTKKGTAVFSR